MVELICISPCDVYEGYYSDFVFKTEIGKSYYFDNKAIKEPYSELLDISDINGPIGDRSMILLSDIHKFKKII